MNKYTRPVFDDVCETPLPKWAYIVAPLMIAAYVAIFLFI